MKRKPRRGRALWLVLSPDGNETLQQYIELHNIDPQTGLAREIEQPGWGLFGPARNADHAEGG